jgi:hypothetical protein
VPALGVHVPDVGLELYPCGQPADICGTGIGRCASAMRVALQIGRQSLTHRAVDGMARSLTVIVSL